MARYITLICEHCGKEFQKTVSHYNFNQKHNRKSYCSRECQILARTKKIEKVCLNCGKTFLTLNQEAKYCSINCYGDYNSQKIERKCKYCGKSFKVKPNVLKHERGNFCCQEHYFLSMKQNNKYCDYGTYYECYVNSSKYGCHTILFDHEDYEKIKNYTIGIYKHHTGSYYAQIYIRENKKSMPLHRFLTNCPKGMVVDHLNHCTLDNRKKNLKICTAEENSANQLNKQDLYRIRNDYKKTYYKHWGEVA